MSWDGLQRARMDIKETGAAPGNDAIHPAHYKFIDGYLASIFQTPCQSAGGCAMSSAQRASQGDWAGQQPQGGEREWEVAFHL